MILTTTERIEGKEITEYLGLVYGEVVNGINAIKDFGAGVRNIFGGRAEGYESEIINAREEALEELKTRASSMGADAVVGVRFEFEVMGQGNMLLLNISGTAVKIK